jgi:hypothetical protein
MKNTIITLTAIVALTLVPRPAAALGDKEAAILGGLLGGVIIGAAIDDAFDNDRSHRNVSSHSSRGHSGSDYGRSSRNRHSSSCGCSSCRSSPSSGHWTYRSIKVWIPQRVSYYYDDCGRRIRHYERGHYTYRKEKVWVSNRRGW